MKKLVFVLMAALSVALTGCSWFDSKPIEPHILGTANLQYETKSGTWYVVIDSAQYTVANVTIREQNPRSIGKTQDIAPVDGMLVTVFTSPKMTGIKAVVGEQSVDDIEELYRTNDAGVIMVFGLLLLCVIGVSCHKNGEIQDTEADK